MSINKELHVDSEKIIIVWKVPFVITSITKWPLLKKNMPHNHNNEFCLRNNNAFF